MDNTAYTKNFGSITTCGTADNTSDWTFFPRDGGIYSQRRSQEQWEPFLLANKGGIDMPTTTSVSGEMRVAVRVREYMDAKALVATYEELGIPVPEEITKAVATAKREALRAYEEAERAALEADLKELEVLKSREEKAEALRKRIADRQERLKK